jgi:hypothetical protein
MDALCAIGLCAGGVLLAAFVVLARAKPSPAPPASTWEPASWDATDSADADERPAVYYHRGWMESQRGGDQAGPPEPYPPHEGG